VLAGIVEEDPDSPALVSGDDEVSYRELDARSSRLARVLIGRGCGPGVGVAVRLDRGIDATVATWAVLKAGAAVIPVGADMVLPTASGADTVPGIEVGLAAFAPAPAEHLDGIDWVVLTDPAVMSEIAAESARPVTYANRIGALRGTDPAFVAEHRVLGYDELAAAVDGLRSGIELTFESRTFHQGPPGALAALLEILAAGAAGASMVLPAESTAAALAEEWVTHLFTDHDGLARLDPEPLEDLQALVLDRGPEPVSGFGGADTFMVLDELVG
jgi:AMP-binding enzyme